MTTESPPPSLPAPSVAAVVLAEDAAMARECLAAVERQVYAPAQVLVVGGGDPVRAASEEDGARWLPAIRDVPDVLDAEVNFVWVLRDRARPREQALTGLLRDAARVDASVIGSKILDSDDPRVLIEVGTATDVFGSPYTGLQEGEIDQSQYDVVRDVAAVSSVSMMIRRDLFMGMRGVDPLMAPGAAAIDFCQRARLRGARVVVAPSSEVLYIAPDHAPDWRERAGEIRAMLKVYSLVTLLWAIPLAFLAGLLESIISPFLGRWKLSGFLAAWGWNLVHLPSTIRGRFDVRRGRQVGDEELFRYQTGGSARLRLLWDETLDRLRTRFPDGMLSGFTDVLEAGQEALKKPTFFGGLLVILFALAATRSVWSGALPISGFALPPPESALDALGAYAGGWNPAGLGSPEVLHPSVAGTALAQLIVFGKSGLAVGMLTLAAFLAGIIGTARLMRLWGVGQLPAYGAGVVLMGSPALIALAGAGRWAPVIALGALPWVLVAGFRAPRRGVPGLIGQVAGVAVLSGVVGVFAPAGLLIAPVAALAWAAVGTGKRLEGAVRVWIGTLLAVPLLIPWLLYTDLIGFFGDGSAFWDPAWPGVAAVAAGAVCAVVAGDRLVASVAGWGAVMAALGTLAARAGDFGIGREAESAGLMAASMGIAAVAGGALGFASRRDHAQGIRFGIGMTGAAAALGLVAATTLVALPGRAGLPNDEYREVFGFAVLADEVPSRILLFGPAGDLPGQARDLEGLGYRVVDPPYPRSWDAYLNEPRLGDDALHATLETLLDGEVRRAGEALAPFGIGWVAFKEESQLQAVFEAQLDLLTLRSFDLPVYRNEEPAPIAAASDGTVWARSGTGFVLPDGPGGVAVRVAGNADYRWGPGDWEQDGWANLVEIPVGSDEVGFGGHGPRRAMAIGALSWFGLLLLAAVTGRLRR